MPDLKTPWMDQAYDRWDRKWGCPRQYVEGLKGADMEAAFAQGLSPAAAVDQMADRYGMAVLEGWTE